MKNKQSVARPGGRAPLLEKIRKSKMARSPHAYVRGNTVRYYEWLERVESGALPEGPAIWICGDCHVGNLGPVGNARGKIEIQIRDLDQTVIGNPVHDLIRLSLSLASAARGSDLPGLTTVKMLERIMHDYHGALAPDFDENRDIKEPEPVRRVAAAEAAMAYVHPRLAMTAAQTNERPARVAFQRYGFAAGQGNTSSKAKGSTAAAGKFSSMGCFSM